jgi:hypothetical protein
MNDDPTQPTKPTKPKLKLLKAASIAAILREAADALVEVADTPISDAVYLDTCHLMNASEDIRGIADRIARLFE